MALLRKKPTVDESDAARAHRLALVADLTFEIVPMKSVSGALEALPPGARVAVTCSPAKGVAATQRVAEELVERGFAPVPHISARMVADRSHTRDIAAWFRSVGINEAFVVGGDAPVSGAYPDALTFLYDLLDTDHPLTSVGVPGYPDGHPLIDGSILHEALHEKQALLAAGGVDGYVATQMCFDAETLTSWLRGQREDGLELPIHLGVSGVVDRRKLMTMGLRLGIGRSLSFVKKNRAAVTKMLTSTAYDPNELLVPLSGEMRVRGVAGLHVFTFNQVVATDAWRRRTISRSDRNGPFSRRIP